MTRARSVDDARDGGERAMTRWWTLETSRGTTSRTIETVDDDGVGAGTTSRRLNGRARGRARTTTARGRGVWALVALVASVARTTNAGVEMLDPADWGVWPSSQLNQNNLTVDVHGASFFSTNVSACRVGGFVVPLTHVSSTLVR